MGHTVIRRVDNIGHVISSLSKRNDEHDSIALQQLRVVRDDLMDMLQSHSIESFGFEKGSLLDASTRKLIKIVETDRNGESKPMRILETLRPGFRYLSDLNSPSTIIRKPEVRVG